MALPYEVNFSVLDGEGKTSSGGFYIKSTQTVANALTEAAGMLQDIADLCVGQITQARLLVPVDITGLTGNGAPNGQSNRRYKFRLIMSSAEGHETALTIPAADQSETEDGSNLVDQGVGTPGEALALGVITRPIATSHDEDVTVVNKFYEVFGR
jgi:hypothetical protein